MKTLIKQALEELIAEAPALKRVLGAMTSLAKETLELSKVVTQLRHDVNLIAEHVVIHRNAINAMVTAQANELNSSKKSSLDISMPSSKSTNENKPN